MLSARYESILLLLGSGKVKSTPRGRGNFSTDLLVFTLFMVMRGAEIYILAPKNLMDRAITGMALPEGGPVPDNKIHLSTDI